jgi:hypothetical protein
MTLRNAFGEIALDATAQMTQLAIRGILRVAQAIDVNGRLRVAIETGNIGTVTTVTTVSTVTNTANQTNMGGVPAQYMATGQPLRIVNLYDNLKVT